MAPLTAEEVVAHPAYPYTDWKLPPTTSGRCAVAKNRRGGPINLYYETHGDGPIKLLWVMGLNAVHTDWKRQTKYFGHENAHKYTCLVFDNRGVGKSDKPLSFYSTSEMAQDAVDLLAHLEWIDLDAPPSRDIHLVGASMGGMIAQEIAMIIPDRLASLTLCCTAPRVVRTAPFLENLRERAQMFIPRNTDQELERLAHSLFPAKFLAEPDDEYEEAEKNFPTRRDRFAAGRLRKLQDTQSFTKKGFLMQVVACYFHHKSAAQLKALGDKVGRERIAVLHGTVDRMLTFHHGELLNKEIGEGILYKVWQGSGHMLPWEKEREFNSLIEGLVQKCEDPGDVMGLGI
ncbi:Alpha/Beta hydrolase protein [Aspergillus pseudoustus]|uniref:Alpha/Beta hydrolase protein n=1 Tax=Aspergillus pseudoustus TaxID=1810923 RepID=A0ABR4J7W0_9EURO